MTPTFVLCRDSALAQALTAHLDDARSAVEVLESATAVARALGAAGPSVLVVDLALGAEDT